MRHFFLTVCFYSFIPGSYSQVVLNGDFENHQASDCQFNLDNVDYNALMENSLAFGPNDEVDLQRDTCGYATVPSNKWFVSLSKRPNGTMSLSLKLSSNLTTGQTYKIAYWEYSADTLGNANIPLHIGLSSVSNSFGELIHSSLPVPGVWTQRSFSFVAPNDGNYITLSVNSPGATKGWNFVDNIEFVEISSAHFQHLENAVNVFPNPSKGRFTVVVPSGVKTLQIINVEGQLLMTKHIDRQETLEFELEKVGLYFVRIQTEHSSAAKKLLIWE